MRAINYRLTDPYLDPVNESASAVQVYSEESIGLPETFWCYDPLIPGEDLPVTGLPALAAGSVTFGCLNNFAKVNQGVINLWARILAAVPDSRLVLLAWPGTHCQRTLTLFQEYRVAHERIEFVTPSERAKYLATYHRIDISLDTFPYNGHTTSLDSFWMGVPVVTLVGPTAVGRGGFSQLMNLGLPEFVATSPDHYMQIATDLARNLPRLTELRETFAPAWSAPPLWTRRASRETSRRPIERFGTNGVASGPCPDLLPFYEPARMNRYSQACSIFI